jgi:hypothetical protein
MTICIQQVTARDSYTLCKLTNPLRMNGNTRFDSSRNVQYSIEEFLKSTQLLAVRVARSYFCLRQIPLPNFGTRKKKKKKKESKQRGFNSYMYTAIHSTRSLRYSFTVNENPYSAIALYANLKWCDIKDINEVSLCA